MNNLHNKTCVVIPVYNHEHAIKFMVDAVLAHNLVCILVDDGSSLACEQVLDQIAAKNPDSVILLRHVSNRGKGAAVITGFCHAVKLGYSHALQIDADGQHCTDDIPHFLAQATANPTATIVGYPQYDESVPKIRLYARYLTHIWVWINTLSYAIKDSMCGFRIYPLADVMALVKLKKLKSRMDFDTDILVRLYWNGSEIINVPTRVRYPIDGVSHFRLLLDNLLISRMHAILFFGMLWRAPKLLMRKMSKRHWAQINEASFITGMRFMFWVFHVFGRWPFQILLYPIIAWYMLTQPTARLASQKYLQHINQYNKTVKSNLLGVIQHLTAFAEMLLDKMLLWSGSLKFNPIKFYIDNHFLTCIEQQRGGLLICAHLGNLDVCRALSKQHNNLKLNILVHTKHAQKFNRFMAEIDPTSAWNLIQVTEITPAFAVNMREKIAQGEFVVIAGDRIPVSANPRVTFASFLGEQAPFPVGPYVLANLLECPIYLICALTTQNGIELYIESFRESIQLLRQHREQALTELASEYAKRLEHYCLLAPLQWFNFYDFWQLAKINNDNTLH